MKAFRPTLIAAMMTALMVGAPAWAADLADKLDRVKVDLVAPPMVHAHEQKATTGPKVLEFTMTIEEKKIVIDDKGTTLQAMTFDGSMPGPTMVVHEGDYVEITLVNPASNAMPHNVDFHAATGALGGAKLTDVAPGEQATMRFKADRSGVFVYHCAPEGMVPWHVVSGMSGTLMVLPRDGLKDPEGNELKYDRAYTIGEFDLYIPKNEDGTYKDYASLADSYADTVEAMRKLIPTHVVFNGKVGALTGEGAMKANVGETVLMIHSQANRDTRPHLIGGHGDWVWETGKFANAPEKNLETWFIRGGSAGAALYTFKQPGVYAYVNHNLIEAFELGAAGHFVVEGKWNDDLMKQIKATGPITKETAAMLEARAKKLATAKSALTPAPKQAAAAAAPAKQAAAAPAKPAAKKVASTHPDGEKLYKTACVACHSTGVANAPKLGDKTAWAPLIEKGMDSILEVAIKGKGAMPPRGASSADDATLRAAVEYMIGSVQ
ncbi:copper-containing nitrite reductase [Pusillimonas sp. SM2304]|uniref:copper-containing nitrite reductase n=1 Tax=Pusillimonas sp. SM2304 TaxID=3073241 RepID=UPI0028760DE1|nr:copper-containing nitrite reductase [Pusillimonas sp. SM2304]MDS1140148.1 copper-containing nitrite reductase [Pusillimonas sp. SM2304]